MASSSRVVKSRGECVVERWLREWTDILEVPESGEQCEMHVGFDEAREHKAAGQVNGFGAAPGGSDYIVPTTNREDFVPGYGQCRMLGKSGVNRQNCAVYEDGHIGVDAWLLLPAATQQC